MRGIRNDNQTNLFSYVQLEGRIPANHPLRKIRQMVDLVLGSMDAYSPTCIRVLADRQFHRNICCVPPCCKCSTPSAPSAYWSSN
jgi:hypothetical protein